MRINTEKWLKVKVCDYLGKEDVTIKQIRSDNCRIQFFHHELMQWVTLHI